ncbi:MAG TPA: ferredoxin [Candidatus Bathyarchaeia archaeon]|nr:ferredoxin [Candidatus Bathyarchaeia archaeon]
MKVKIDKNKCIGCGTCAAVAPKAFKLGDDSKAKAIEPLGEDEKTIKDAIDSCPVKAIELTD